MKRLFTLCILALLIQSANAQIILTEIMFNPPESGDDSLEYLEIYNSGDLEYNMSDHSFSSGIEYNFGDMTIAPKSYFLLVKDSAAMEAKLGVTATQWTSGSLNNGGESVSIIDASSNVILELTYDDNPPWPLGTDGEGASIVLCDLDSDYTNAENWRASTTATGVFTDNIEIKASPGQPNQTECTVVPDYIIEARPDNTFSPDELMINPGERVRFVNMGGNHNVNGTITTFPLNPDGFTNGAPSTDAWTYDVVFTRNGLYTYQCDPHAGLGMSGTIQVGEPVVEPTFPRYSIPQVTTENDMGVADSLMTECELTGIVYGNNLRPNGLQFFLVDADNNGIAVFSNSDNFGYTPTQGDEVVVRGFITQFRGLTQLEVSGGIDLVSQGNTDVSAKLVTEFLAEDESSFIALEGFLFVDEALWEGNSNSSGFNFPVTKNGIEYVIRIDNDNPLFLLDTPPDFNAARGNLGQFDQDEPFTEGYQLLPRDRDDLYSFLSVDNVFDQFTISPNPAMDFIQVESDEQIDQVSIYNIAGQLMLQTNDYNQKQRINLNFESGTYLLKVRSGNNVGQKVFTKI